MRRVCAIRVYFAFWRKTLFALSKWPLAHITGMRIPVSGSKYIPTTLHMIAPLREQSPSFPPTSSPRSIFDIR